MSGRARTLGIALLVCWVLAAPGGMRAQDAGCTVGSGTTCALDLTLRLETSSVISLTLSDAFLALPSPPLARGTQGVTVQGPTAYVSANTDWQLLIATATATWRGDGATSRAKPASDLRWSTAAPGPFTPMSQSPAMIARGGPGGRTPVPTWFGAVFDPARDGPGQYEITVNYTIVAP